MSLAEGGIHTLRKQFYQTGKNRQQQKKPPHPHGNGGFFVCELSDSASVRSVALRYLCGFVRDLAEVFEEVPDGFAARFGCEFVAH